jgi:clan AA aspartic protease (TIGR02281 family)
VKYSLTILGFFVAFIPSIIAYAALMGLGIHRHGSPAAVAFSATCLVFIPALTAAGMRNTDRTLTFVAMQGVWAIGLLAMFPLYFPGERSEAIASGLALVLDNTKYAQWSEKIPSYLPPEPTLSEQQPLLATALVVPKPPVNHAVEDDSRSITLPFEGSGSRLSLPVVFEHGSSTLEVEMMLDTGATYTTLSREALRKLGIAPTASSPQLELHTANGMRVTPVVLLDRVWLGDLAVDGIAITVCDDCASDDITGLLGLNVSGAYNLSIDADRQEVRFKLRHEANRKLDIKPFSKLNAGFTRYPAGRIEVSVSLQNQSPRHIEEVQTLVSCDDNQWLMPLQHIAPYQEEKIRRRLPDHEPCETYEVSMEQAHW